jgi:hypothetical protein
MHVDDFMDDLASDPYAAWMFRHFRLSAADRIRFDPFMKDRQLFCTYGGKRWRVVGASRLGDVWLAQDPASERYDRRADVAECSAWGAAG